LGEQETVNSVWQLNLDAVHKDSLWGQQNRQILDLDLDGSQTSLRATDVVLVDRHFVCRLLLAVLHQGISARPRVGEGLLVKCDIVLTSPRHAHRMTLELVFFDGVTVVVLHCLSARRPRVVQRTCAGVRCRALPTVHACLLAHGLVTELPGVAVTTATDSCLADYDAVAAMSTCSSTVGYFTKGSGVSSTTTGTLVDSDT